MSFPAISILESEQEQSAIMSQIPGIEIREAIDSDVSSLSTVVARAFHPVNPYIKQCIPDTAQWRQWWEKALLESIADPKSHPLTALDLAALDESKRAIGLLCLTLFDPDERGAGMFTLAGNPFPSDGDNEALKAMVGTIVEHRERLMLGRTHFLLELFGVDNTYKGRGIGLAMLCKACDIADEAGHDVFVQANASAKDFYAKFGFQVQAESVMPGELQYREYLMLRPYKKQ
ncbi:Hypothetical protein R9X50_00518700 [Acrodontium crateriforme]|uniref:N-acetyltransferase domain-containing protein n=1 Tax=Acrodontium crateriforme TaxID=150365 RepID=A0AAQ3R8Y3_9PEZI|nr:Hypothetical protein R9X50_00518700 [Acrodontium crateriforme]